jgi:2-oxoglutarate ferredoxin oxidoreductase subunit gamma
VNEIRISGFGGQGIIRCGYIVGKTASLFDAKFATLTQSFGPEARGSACSAQVLVDKDPIRYPYVTIPDTVVCMSQEAYDKFGSHITDDGVLMIDEDLVKIEGPPKGGSLYSIPATRIAEQLGQRIVANIVMLGFFTAVTDIISAGSVRKSLPSSVPERFVDLNLKAFEQGYEYGLTVTGKLPEDGEKPAPKPKKKAAARKPAPKPKKKAAAKRPAGKAKKKAAPRPKKKAAAKAKPKKAAAKRKPAKARPKKAAAKKTTRAKTKKKPAARAKPKKKAAAKKTTRTKKRAKPRARRK